MEISFERQKFIKDLQVQNWNITKSAEKFKTIRDILLRKMKNFESS